MLASQFVNRGRNRWEYPREGRMQVPVRLYLPDHWLETVDDESIQQLLDAAELAGTTEVFGLPDIHSGYGLPIGGVLATEAPLGVISAGAVGMDINCGVRLLRSNMVVSELNKESLRTILGTIEQRIPAGIGKDTIHKELQGKIAKNVVEQGVQALSELDMLWDFDLPRIEDQGCFPGGSLDAVSKKAKERFNQLGTIGGGNHFIELQEVVEVHDTKAADVFGLFLGQLVVMLHSGSRGFGQQVCTDYSRLMLEAQKKYGLEIGNKGLAAVPLFSEEGQRYWQAMAATANYAYANRQVMTYDIRTSIEQVMGKSAKELGLSLVFDVAHNLARMEEHEGKELIVHRKGSIRALPPEHQSNPDIYRKTGHPVFVPGSMGTSSYVLTGLPSNKETLHSINHGAGRIMSRTQARKGISSKQLKDSMKGIVSSKHALKSLDEAPAAYKDIDAVIETLVEIGFTRHVAKLRPIGVIKG